ncbi:tetratricopeptide repeat protein [Croceivirga thetidis]|uniref:Tetratricopeptide repeat protein n=1 Tax=Croceivirga thetidis TaxID=2721623 RepID=A0ABX1GR13_9FLAO|nr:tetratricopeptide repeat protein [Croceivirga thetidis]NKI32387.1 tetratricopeptide repeat protein [Croceivirga thetidis]
MSLKSLVFPLIIVVSIQTIAQTSSNSKVVDSLLNVVAQHKSDTVGAKTLHALFDQYMYVDWNKALEYAKKEYDLSKKINYLEGIGKGHLHSGMAYYFLDNMDSTRIRFDQALEVFNEIEADFLSATTYRNYSIIEYENGNYDKALKILDNSILLFKEKLNDSIGMGISYETKSKVYVSKGNYRLALQNALRSLRILEKAGNKLQHANALYNMGYTEFHNKNYQKSIDYNARALKVYLEEDEKWWAAQAYNDLGNNYYYLDSLNKSEEYLNKAIEFSKEVDAKWIECSSLGALGKVRLEKKDYDDANRLFNESLKIARSQNLKFKIIEALTHKGEISNLLGNPTKGILYLDESISLAESIGAKDKLKIALNLRAKCYSQKNNYELAFNDYQNLISVNDSIYTEKKSQQIQELTTIYETEKKEAEIALQEEEINTLNEKAKVDKLTKGLYAGGMASALALFGLSVFGFRQRIKKNRIAREKQEEIYKQEIAHKKKELASQTLHLVQKNTFLEELKENLENLKSSPDKFKMEFRRIVMLLKKEKASDKDWETFKTYFSEVHNDFDQKLKTLYADISEKEIRLAAFLRMNLTTKEIAATLNVLPDSILKSKYRLKKKLGLDKETDLTSFLSSL